MHLSLKAIFRILVLNELHQVHYLFMLILLNLVVNVNNFDIEREKVSYGCCIQVISAIL